ncbi:hypothetical protein CLHUN_42030 [Ruminiclostridium hungatei]|uniref:Peptidase C39-like domain-containing protein n=1 Tax=Ruminiclostridium hungatei TaxID=48256 RepID=A0A1V4SDL4_RUMHU|nr:papain-like cysteine protease family protein [Ruminiclostridium hungatei]OPX41914.1 hypothetical protein CLHUN_42030 [Ruminiclostridium hungatei]
MRNKSRKVSRLIAVILILVLFTQSIFAASTNVSPITQEKSNWCWAACIRSILQGSESQSSIVSYIMGPSLPNFTADSAQVRRAINHFASNVYTERFTTTLNYKSIKSNIDQGYPIIALIIGRNNSVGHYIVIFGYQDSGSNPNINYMDPYNATKYSIPFNSLLTGFQKTYNGTTQNFSWYETVSVLGN